VLPPDLDAAYLRARRDPTRNPEWESDPEVSGVAVGVVAGLLTAVSTPVLLGLRSGLLGEGGVSPLEEELWISPEAAWTGGCYLFWVLTVFLLEVARRQPLELEG